ncbi:PIN domain-containing protein [Persephonella sp.]
MKSILVDANVILRYLLADNKDFFEKSEEVFNRAFNGEIEVYIKEVVIAEVVYVLEKFYNLDRQEIAEVLKNLLLLRGIKTENKVYVLRAFDIYADKKLDFVDCILCVMSEDYEILTFDKKLNKCIK